MRQLPELRALSLIQDGVPKKYFDESGLRLMPSLTREFRRLVREDPIIQCSNLEYVVVYPFGYSEREPGGSWVQYDKPTPESGSSEGQDI